jgi:hypothetical protein
VGNSSFTSSDGESGTGDEGNEDEDTDEGNDESTDDSDSGMPKLDVDDDPDPDPDECKVVDDDGVGVCTDQAPPDSFDPVTEWEWWGEDGYTECAVTPLVANFTDDDDNGEVDLCDTPDVLVVADDSSATAGARMYLLDGGGGAVHFEFDSMVDHSPTPAIGDIDGDGLVEVVTTKWSYTGSDYVDPQVIAFEHDGSVKWTSSVTIDSSFVWATTVALADLDNDGEVDIVVGRKILDNEGYLHEAFSRTQIVGTGYAVASPVPADLDGDGDLEIIYGRVAYHHDGEVYYEQPALETSGFAQVADMDDDPEPEILITGKYGITLLEHDGSVIYLNQRPTGADTSHLNWTRPAAIHDLDDDDSPEYMLSSKEQYSAYNVDASIMWSAPVLDGSGAAAGTAFDFLGDGTAEAMYGDETNVFVFDGANGNVLLQIPRGSWTAIEFPSVADVDNDGSAEILVANVNTAATVHVIADAEDRWIPARRIWNQHAYHVTNVREDGTIPQFQSPSWESLNTFRTQAQITAGGGTCIPPEG